MCCLVWWLVCWRFARSVRWFVEFAGLGWLVSLAVFFQSVGWLVGSYIEIECFWLVACLESDTRSVE